MVSSPPAPCILAVPVQLAPGDRVGQYEILSAIGAGGMGEVYAARDERLGREIALKILPAELSSTPEALRRFEQEARAASALNHPNIVTIYETGQSEAFAWIAMELVEGEDLRALSTREPLSLKTALRIATRMADGLAAAHERGIVHRDLKPDNVMITPEGFVKLLDFGLAKQLRMLTSDEATVPHTEPGTIFGTVGYMSPEQATGREMDARSDQFSFGVMLYEMITRLRPFERASKPETLAAILRDDPPPPSSVDGAIPRELDRIVLRCLEKNPRERYGSTRDLARDLREVRDQFSQPGLAEARTLPMPLFKRRHRAAALAGLLLVLLIGAVALWQRRDATRRITSIAVVPFRDLSGTPEGQVLADGVSEMLANRLAEVRELRIATPFDGAPIADGDDVRVIARRTGAHAVVRGSVQRGEEGVRVTASLLDAESGRTLAATTVTRAAGELFALQDSVAEDLLRSLGRDVPGRFRATPAALSADDQRRFTEAVGLLRRVQNEESVDRAIASLEAILRNARQSPEVNALLARALLYKASLARRPALVEQATVYATRGVALGPEDPETHITLGQLRIASGRFADAVSSFERALALRPEHPEAIVGLAEAYEGQGRAGDAEQLYQKVLLLRADATGAMMKYGGLCFMQGRYEEAARHFRKVAELRPEFSHAQANLGAALQAMGNAPEALAAFQKSLSISPTASGFSNLGTLQFSLGRYQDARQSYERAAQLAPSDFVLWANLGDACRWIPEAQARAGEAYAQAIRLARESIALNPNDAYARSVIALALARSGQASEAQEEIRRALEIDPTNPSILYKAAVISLIRGSDDGAVSWIERAVASGYPAAELARDPELQSLRRLPAFQKAVK